MTVVWDRTAANLRGRISLVVVALGGNHLLRWATRRSLADIDRAYQADS